MVRDRKATTTRSNAPALPRGRRRGQSRSGQTLLLSTLVVTSTLFNGGCEPSAPPPPPPSIVTPPPGLNIDPDIQAAIERSLVLIGEQPANPNRHGQLAMVYEANELFDLSHRAYECAATLAPKNASWVYHSAISLIHLDRKAEARQKLLQVTQTNPMFAAAWQGLGLLALESGEIATARQAFDEAQRQAPREPAPRVGVADCLNRSGQQQQAIQMLEEIVSQNPKFKPAHQLLGQIYRAHGDEPRALPHLAKGREAEPNFLQDRTAQQLPLHRAGVTKVMERGAALLQQGSAREALNLFEDALVRHPSNAPLLIKTAEACVKLERIDQAQEYLARSIQAAPEDYEPFLRMAILLAARKRLPEALAAAETAVQRGPLVSDTHFVMGQILMFMTRYEDARAPLEQTVALAAEVTQTHLALAEVYTHLGRLGDAVSCYERVLQDNPQDPRILGNLGVLRSRLGREDEARKALTQLENVAPDHPMTSRLREILNSERKP